MVTSQELKAEGNKAFGNLEYKKAAKLYRDAIKLDPSNAVLYSNRSQCFLKIGDFDRALRDSVKGLELSNDMKLQTKLYFRKGLALKSLGKLQLAQDSFQHVLEIDPQNGPALEELSNTDRARKKTKLDKNESSGSIEIPIQEVDSLPDKYAKLLGKPVERIEPMEIDPKPVEEVIETGKEAQPEILSLRLLSRLTSLAPKDKAKAYNYVISLDKEEYISTFGTSGIDTEFLQFFIEAAAYVSTNETLPHWDTTILALLCEFSKLKRYQLSLEFCEKLFINTLIENVEKKTSLINQYKQYV